MSFWPFFDLTVRTPRVELRGATDALLEEAAALRVAGIASPGEEPIGGDSSLYYPSPEHEWRFFKAQWGARAKTTSEWWFTPFAVVVDGQLVGMQEMTAVDFPTLRTVESNSWLGLAHQGQGIGKEMRAAIMHLAFAGFGALRAESVCFFDNARSRAVSLSLGYQPNGSFLAKRPSGGAVMERYLLTRETWEQGRRDDIEIHGLEPCLAYVGLSNPEA
jgi:RimJ/RimL family protein N-acetyltransferase